MDDFCGAAAGDWGRAGPRLLTAIEGSVQGICACHDRPKQDLLRALDFPPGSTGFRKAVSAE